jgi:hypothetical protein
MKRVVYLAMAALVALLILVPSAMAQDTTAPKAKMEQTVKMEKTMEEPLPKSGGPQVVSVLLPAAALLVGSGILAYAVLRRR